MHLTLLAALAASEETAKSNSGAAAEVRALKDSMKERVEAAVKDRLFSADKRIAELEVAADAAAAAQGRADTALSEMRRLHEGVSTQLFEIEEAREQGRQSSSNEVEALSAEAERLRQREAGGLLRTSTRPTISSSSASSSSSSSSASCSSSFSSMRPPPSPPPPPLLLLLLLLRVCTISHTQGKSRPDLSSSACSE